MTHVPRTGRRHRLLPQPLFSPLNENPRMRPRNWAALLPALLLILAACGDRASGPSLSANDLARAGDLRLTIDDAADILAPVETLPNDPEVVRALADFWTDYTLLALALHGEGGLERVDLSSITEPQEKQSLVLRLRDEVIDDDIDVSDADVEALWESERPGEEVRARHILLLFPPDATQAQRDSVQAQAEDLRRRLVGGADFAQLARDFSEDPGSAQRGGDLDYFPRGVMVPPFEEAAFSTPPGTLSEIVESQFGLHIIRVEDLRSPTLDEMRDEIREMLRQDRVLSAESTFVADTEAAANVRVEDGATGLMREVAEAGGEPLPRRTGQRVLARFEGGSFTAADFQEFLASQPPGILGQVEGASDQELRGLLDNLVRSEVLVAEARRLGIEPDREETTRIVEGIQEQFRQVAGAVGLDTLERGEGESLNQAIQRRVREILDQVVRGETDVFPLQGLALPLRNHFGAAVSDAGVERAVERVEARRGEGGPDGESLPFDLPEPDGPMPDDPSPDASPDPAPDGEPDDTPDGP
jgi:peptidyl-prolyl cis-trans isomerase C